MQRLLAASIATLALAKGYVLLNLLLLPVTLLLTLYIGIMAGGAPNAEPLQAFAMVVALLYLAPAGVFLGHLLIAKVVDTVLCLVPPLTLRTSWVGILAGSISFVIAGNIFVDNLHQFRQGDFTLSLFALVADLVGMAAVAGAGLIPIRFIDRFLTLGPPPAS